MANVTVFNWDKKKVGEVELVAAVFEQPVKEELLHTVIRWQLACRRQGTAMTKTKGLVSGGGKKPFKQKGTGNARQGSTRSPLMPGGGTMFGPQPRDYSYALPRKVRQAGLRTALSYLQKEGKLFIVEDMKSEGKTGEIVKRLAKFGVAKAVLVDQEADSKFDLATRNLTKFRYYSVDGLNVYDLLKYDAAIVTKASLTRILGRCGLGDGTSTSKNRRRLNMYEIIKKPLISEKNAGHAEDSNTYAFEVDLRADKTEIKKAIEKAFNVKVELVRTQICRGRYFRKQMKLGPPKHWKKALVKLQQGEKISIFEGA